MSERFFVKHLVIGSADTLLTSPSLVRAPFGATHVCTISAQESAVCVVARAQREEKKYLDFLDHFRNQVSGTLIS